MNIGMISDLHIDYSKEYPITEELIQLIRETRIEVLLIAGDISESVELTLNTIEQLNQDTSCKVYFVPGNHDMWDKQNTLENGFHTEENYKKYLVCPYCISGKVIELKDDWVLFGDIGWYDYSFGKGYEKEQYDEMTFGKRTWHDKLYNVWSKDNQATHQWQLQSLKKTIAPYRDKHKILVTHMVSHPAFTVPEDWSKTVNWAYFNAFLGSKDYQTLCEEENVDYALMGHVHYRGELRDGATTYVCSCLNYYNEWQSDNLGKELGLSLRVFTI